MLELAGHSVSREYYFNNAGGQIDRLGASVRALARHEPVPEDGYKGDYVAEPRRTRSRAPPSATRATWAPRPRS